MKPKFLKKNFKGPFKWAFFFDKIKLLLLLSFFSLSYSFTISGIVIDSKTGEPISYSNILIEELNIGTASDNNGYYIISNIKDGKYTMKFMVIGYAVFEKIVIIKGSNQKIDIELKPEAVDIDEVKVSAERMRFEKKVDISRVNLTNRDIRKVPAFIESDVFRTLQLLPSVSSANDFNAALIVRGGSPDENLILLDGVELYNPYHVGGIFSTFNADMISDSEFLAGGFPANYGGRLSSVLSITSRVGDHKNGKLSDKNPIKKYIDFSRGSGNISLLSTKLLAEGALLNGSWILSLRRTYFDKFVDLYYSSKDESPPVNYFFWDSHFKGSIPINSNNKLIFSQFNGKDDLMILFGGDDFPGIDFDWVWGNSTRNLTWRYIPNSNYLITTSAAMTKYDFDVGFEVDFNSGALDPDSSETLLLDSESADLSLNTNNIVKDITFNQNIKYIYNEKLNFNFGWQIKMLDLDFIQTFSGEEVSIGSKPQINNLFFNMNINPFPIFRLNAGMRLTRYSKYDNYIITPKISLKYNPTSELALKLGWGSYNQFLFTFNDDEELLRIVDFWQPIPEGKKPQEAYHYVLGLEYWLEEGNTISFETYYKYYSCIYDRNPFPDPLDRENTYALPGTANAYGVELLYRYDKGRISGWLSYAFSKVEREVDLNSDGFIWGERENYPAKYEKPHSFNALVNYYINKFYTLGVTFIFGSGQTYTPVIGKVHQTGVDSYGSLENPYLNFGNIYGKRNGARYPNYFRMDVSLSKKTNLFGMDGTWNFQIINLTNNYNVLFYNWNHEASPSRVQAYSMFPFIFSLGWEFNI